MAQEAVTKGPAPTGLWGWINKRLPVDGFLRSHAVDCTRRCHDELPV